MDREHRVVGLLARLTARRSQGDGGVTMIELMVTMAIFGILTTMAVWGLVAYGHATAESGSAQGIVEALRNAQTRAQAEDVTYEVHFSPGTYTSTCRSWTVLRLDPFGTTQVSAGSTTDNTVCVTTSSFTQSSGAASSNVYFYPRGTASAGTLALSRKGSTKTYTVTVEGLTSRVTMG